MVRLSEREKMVLENILQTKVTSDKGKRLPIRHAGCFWVKTADGHHFFVRRLGDAIYATPEGARFNSDSTKGGYLGEPTR